MHRLNRAFTHASLYLLAGALSSLSASAQQVPQTLQPPANEQPLLQVHANGDQIYS